jgi:casein kinase II subunit alpha
VKTAPRNKLETEREVLSHFRSKPYIRQLVDEIDEPPALVLNFLDDNLLDLSGRKRLERRDVKLVARSVLEALKQFHEAGYVHTGTASISISHATNSDQDVKPDNIFVTHAVNPPEGQPGFSTVELGDCGDCYRLPANPDPKEDGHLIGAAIFRSPEAMLNLRWDFPTDIWSFGTTVCIYSVISF